MWWGQFRDFVSTAAGLIVLGVEVWRGTYAPVAVAFVAACLGVVTTSTFSRWLIGRINGRNGGEK